MGLPEPAAEPEPDRAVAEVGWKLMRSALQQLAAEAGTQRQLLAGSAVADELALDLDHAFAVLDGAGVSGTRLDEVAVARLLELSQLLEEQTRWGDADLDADPVWVRARELARQVLRAVDALSCG